MTTKHTPSKDFERRLDALGKAVNAYALGEQLQAAGDTIRANYCFWVCGQMLKLSKATGE